MAGLDYAVNALGYSPSLGRLVALTTRKQHEWWNPAHIVLLDKQGVATDMGAIRAPWYKFDDVNSGAVVGGIFYVRDSHWLHAVDIDPNSAQYLKIIRSVHLEPSRLGASLDDFALNPADGRLYSVSSEGRGPGKVVTIDPVSGVVTKVAAPEGLPGGSTYGAIVADNAGTVYALNNGFLGQSRLFRITLGGAYPAGEVAAGPAVVFTDGAGCLPAPMPPQTPVPIPPPQPVPPAPPAPAPPAPKPPAAVVPPPPPAPPAPPSSVTPQPQPVAPRAPGRRPEAREVAAEAPAPTTMSKSRKWAIATIVLVLLGASGAAARSRR